MENLRSKVAKKTANFMRVAQQPPAPPLPDAAPGGAAPAPRAPARPAPAPGVPGAPPPLAAPLPPPSPVDKLDKQVEQNKMQEVKLDKVEQAVTKNNEQMESLVDAIVDMKQVMETTLLGEPGMDDKLRKLKEKQKENQQTSDEFGLDKDNLIVSKEEGNMATAAIELRQARKQRLASDLKHRPEKYSPEGLKFEDAEPENKKYKQDVPAPQITKVKKDETPDLFRIALDLSDDESKWSVVDKQTEQVLFEISKTEENAEGFNTEAFARAVIADMKALGIKSALQKHGAVPMLPMLDKDDLKDGPGPKGLGLGPKGPGGPLPDKKLDGPKDLDKKPGLGIKPDKDKLLDLKIVKKDLPMKDDLKDELKKEESSEQPIDLVSPQAKQAEQDIRRRFMRAFRLALSAQQKNLIDNPLKAAWFTTLSSMGVENPQLVIESTFTNAALDQFEVALQKADEYLNMNDEAFIETESTIGDFRTSVPEVEPVVPATRQSALAMQERAKRASMVVSTASDSESTDRSAAIAQALPMPKLAGISRFANRR